MKDFLSPINLNQNEVKGGAFDNLSSAPLSPILGQFYINTTDSKFYGWDGSSWLNLSIVTTTNLSEGTNLYYTDVRARAAITGTVNRITSTSGVIDISSAYIGQSSITTVGTLTTGTWNAATIAANYGGTGFASYTIGDILYANTTTTLAKLAGVATGNALISGGVGAAPNWGKIGLTTHVSGTLPIANGGTGQTTATLAFNALSPLTTKGDILVHDGTDNVRQGIGTNDFILTADSTQANGLAWKALGSTTFNFSSVFRRSGIISPAALTGNQDNWNPTGLSTANVIRIDTTGNRNITGIAAQESGREIVLFNIGGNNITLQSQNAGSTAANRFILNANITLASNESTSIWYDATTQRWRAMDAF